MLILLCVLFSINATANHILGGNITYDCLGGDTYGITLTVYKDCFGATPATIQENLFFIPNGCTLPFSSNLPLISEIDVSDLCPTELANSSCNGGLNPGTQQLTYYGEVVLDSGCNWDISWAAGDWNYFINMDNGMLPTAYFLATIDPTVNACASSVSVSSQAIPYACIGDLVEYTLNVDNPSGYDLVMSLTCPLTAGGFDAPTIAACTEPIAGLVFDPLTGQITFVAPSLFGNYVVTIEIEMYEGGVLVGTVLHTMAFTIRLCDLTPTTFNIPEIQSSNDDATVTGTDEITVCAGDSLCFEVSASNGNIFRSIDLSTDFETLFPTGTFIQNGNNPALGELCVLTDASMVGTTVVTIDAVDDACPDPNTDQILITVNILPSLNVNVLDTLICSGEMVNIEATGDAAFNWNVIFGDAAPLGTGGNQTLSPSTDSQIEIVAINATAACNYRDTLNIAVSLSTIDAIVVDESCAENDGSIDVTVGSGSGNYSFNWPEIPSVIEDQTNLGGGTYTVQVTDLDLAGCTRDTLITIVDLIPPSGGILGDTTICEGSCAEIHFDLIGTGPFTVELLNLTTGLLEAVPLVPGQLDFEVCPLVSTTYELQQFLDGNAPQCLYTAPATQVTVTVRPAVSASFTPVAAICAGETVDLEVNIDLAGVFVLEYNPNDGNPTSPVPVLEGDIIQVTPAATTTYNITSIAYTDLPGCANTLISGTQVQVNPLPTAALTGTQTLCEGDQIDLIITLTGTGPWEVTHDYVNDVSPLAIAVSPFTWTLPAGMTNSTDIALTGVTDLGTSCTNAATDQVTVTINLLPVATFASDVVICLGESADLIFDLPNGGTLDVELTLDDGIGTSVVNVNDIVDGFVYQVTPTTTTTYEITTLTDNTVIPVCETTPADVATVTVNTAPLVLNVDTICANTATSYEFIFEISNGDPATYDVNMPGTLTLIGMGPDVLYTSDPMVPEDGATFLITDANDCGITTITLDPFTCPTLTFSGTVDLAADTLCDVGLLTTVHDGDEVLDPNDALSFVIHSIPGPGALGVVYFINDTPSWDIVADLDMGGTLQYDVQYYISAVAGDDDGSGIVDLGALGISVSEGTPFVIVESPTAALSGGGTICANETIDLQLNFTGFGDYDVTYLIDGVEPADSPIMAISANPFSLQTDAEGTFTLQSVSNAFCAGTVQGDAVVLVNPIPTGTLTGSGSFCEGESIDLILELTGAADWDVTIANDADSDGIIDFTETITTANANEIYQVSDSLMWFIDEITDGNGCTNALNSDTALVTINALPTAEYQFGDTSFCAGSEVDIIVDLTGTANWTLDYAIDGGPVSVNVIASPLTFSVGVGGTVCLSTLTDNNGCLAIVNECIDITEIAIPIASAGPDFILCSGNELILGLPDNPNYTYEWSPADSLDNAAIAEPTFTGLNTTGAPVDFIIELTVNDEFCSTSDEVTITLQELPAAFAGDDIDQCFGEDAQLNALGGGTYLWEDNGAFTNGGTDIGNPLVVPTVSDWFVVQVTDAAGCFSEDSLFINVPDEFIVNENFSADLCFGTCDGFAALNPQGGYDPYSFAWDTTVETLDSLTLLCAGNYTYTVTDDNGCELTNSLIITELLEYYLDDVLTVNPNCFATETGSIDVISGTGIEFGIEELSLENGTGVFLDLPAGDYSIYAVDAVGCLADSLVTLIAGSNEITIDVDFTELVICVGEEVTLNATANGGDGNFTYEWFDGFPPAVSMSDVNPFILNVEDDLEAFVVAIDGLGCASDTLLSVLSISTPIEIEAGPLNAIEICEGECIDLTANISGGTGTIEIDWVDITFSNDTIAETAAAEVCPPNVVNISYVVFANDGCTFIASDTVVVTVFDNPIPVISVDVFSGCYPVSINLVNETPDSELVVFCEWDLGDGSIQQICGDISYIYNLPGVYEPQLTVTSVFGCTATANLDALIEVFDYPIAEFTWTPFSPSTLDSDIDFTNETIGANQYEWDFAGIGTSIEDNPSFQFPAIDLANYIVCLNVASEEGCSDTICHDIFIRPELLIYVPNTFTPDNDGINEVFAPVIGGGIYAEGYLFRIWDRWGNLIFETTQIGQAWTGNNSNGGYYVQNDVYVWEVQFRDLLNAENYIQKGHVNVLR